MMFGGSPAVVWAMPAELLRQRFHRERILPRLTDCDWTILLTLWDAKERGVCLNISKLMHGCYAPPTTALRRIALFERKGLIERFADSEDQRIFYVELTAQALEKLNKIFAACEPQLARAA